MFQQFVQRITWEFDYSYDCNDENDTFYSSNYGDSDLIAVRFVLQPIR